MEASFWHQKWQKGELRFHENAPNALLQAHFKRLNLASGSRIFLPLCGKTLDIGWLLAKGYRVAGCEISALAIQQLFEELNLSPDISNVGASTSLQLFKADNIDIFVGDFFEMTAEMLNHIDAIYDRAALVALPDKPENPMRRKYATHLQQISKNADQLLISFEYDQSLLSGPPFSVREEMIRSYYENSYQISLLQSQPLEGGLKNKVPALETAWLLKSLLIA